MNRFVCITLGTCLAVSIMTFAGCSSETPSRQASSNQAPAVATTLPADLFSAEPVANLSTLLEVKDSKKPGDEVAFVATIAGRAKPFTDERAVMLVADLALPYCTDGCPVPWDACCATPESVARNTATVQVVDDAGMPLRTGFNADGTLKPGDQIQVSGIVGQAGEGIFVVNARRIHVAR